MKLDLAVLDTIDRLMAKKSAWTLEETAAVYDAVPALVREVRAAREWLKDYDIAGTAGGRAARETYRKVCEENSRD